MPPGLSFSPGQKDFRVNYTLSYAYTALEEALANAVYHRDYAIREPIEVSIHPDRIEILSFPGPMPPLKIEVLGKNWGLARKDR